MESVLSATAISIGIMIGLSFLGSENEKKCNALASEKGFKSPYLKTSREKEVSEEFKKADEI